MILKAPSNKKTIFAWCMYDWANSSFTTLVVTFVYGTYFATQIAPNAETGTALWSRAIGISAVIIALLSPFLGAIADKQGVRQRLLILFTLICVSSTATLTFVKPSFEHAILLALMLFIIANVAYELGIVFYNSFLPSIASEKKIGRISGYGWGSGYAGGIICMLVALLVFARETPLFSISTVEGFNYRATNLLVAGWFFIFSLPLFFFAPPENKPEANIDIKKTLSDLKQTLRVVCKYREVVKFLIAHLIYNDGLVTLFAFGGIYAAGTFDMKLGEVILFGIVLNIAAGLGAFMFGFIDDKIGGKMTILTSLLVLSLSTITAVLAPTKLWLWISGIAIGIFVGPNQSASRSLMGRFTPEKHQSEFYGFFTLSGKITSFLGPILLGATTTFFNSQRAGIATIFIFFLTGGVILSFVNENQGIKESTTHTK